jgi:hypothetical protein
MDVSKINWQNFQHNICDAPDIHMRPARLELAHY